MPHSKSDDVWRTVGDVRQKRCPTCAARGREQWHLLEDYGTDISNEPPITIRCRQCMREDWLGWAAQRDVNAYYREHPSADGGRQKRYYDRKVAAGWRKRDSRWVRADDEEEPVG